VGASLPVSSRVFLLARCALSARILKGTASSLSNIYVIVSPYYRSTVPNSDLLSLTVIVGPQQ